MKRSKLSNKLSMLYATLFGAVFFVLSVGVLICAYYTLWENKREYVSNTMPIFTNFILEEIAEGERIDNPNILREQAFDLNLNITLYSPDGAVISHVRNFYMNEAALPHGLNQIHSILTPQNDWLLCYQSELYDGLTHYGSLQLVCNLANEINYLKLLGMLLLCANVLGVVAAAVVGRFISRKMLSPIDAMIKEAAQIDSQKLKMRLPVPEPDDELRRLSITLNHMLEHVEDAFAQQSRFTADASHELRTPLAIMHGYTELLQRWGSENKEVREECILALAKQTQYMHSLLENMLFLARGESRKLHLSKQDFSVQKLLEELYDEQAKLDPAHTYRLVVTPDVRLLADRAMIRQLISALLNNSRKFTPGGGCITLSASASGKGVELSVCDTGIGISPEHITHIFERFYRVDTSRNRADGGAGLGLSIVAAIAEVHGACVNATSEPGKGACITVLFPA